MGLDSISNNLGRFETLINTNKGKKKIRPPTRLWLLAEEVALVTSTTPNRWLRECKKNEWAVNRALIDLKESTPRSRIRLFNFLLKKYKEQDG